MVAQAGRLYKMSHNKLTVQNQSPDSAGNISLDLNNLDDVNTGTPSNNDYLKYISGEWQAAASTSTTPTIEHIWIGEGASQTYPEAWTNGNDVYFYSSSSPTNTIAGATVTSSDSHSNWYDEFNLPSGSYFIYTRIQADFSSSSGYVSYKVHDGAAVVAPTGYAVASGNSSEFPQLIQTIIELSSSASVSIRLTTTSSTTTASTEQGLYGFILIQKVA